MARDSLASFKDGSCIALIQVTWILSSVVVIALGYTFYPSEYDRLMRPVIAAKKASPHIVVDGEIEPPWPEEELNSQTIMGVDSNHNGVRDDVEIWINRTISDSNLRKGLKQYVRSYTRELIAAPLMNKKISFDLTQKTEEAFDCEASAFFGDDKVTDEKINLHSELLINIRSILIYPRFRVRANTLRFNLLAGHMIGGIKTSVDNPYQYCEFQIDSRK